MRPLPPGTILQNLYLKRRIRNRHFKNFLEIGSGNGYLSNLLLDMGLEGIGCDLNPSACNNNLVLNAKAIQNDRYKVINDDLKNLKFKQGIDLIISSMVIEHLSILELNEFITTCKGFLNPEGTIIFLVPSSMKHWGIEDDVAGHIRRFEFSDFNEFNNLYGLELHHMAGLTYPISNWMLSISNNLIKKHESEILNKSQLERTIYTGNRNVPYKTTFPSYFKLLLNECVMFPLHLLQLVFTRNPNCLVIYCELKIKK